MSMYENIAKSYENAKDEAERWYDLATKYDKRDIFKKEDGIEAVYWIGRAVILNSILVKEYCINELEEERKQLEDKKSEITVLIEELN